jgi:hypothetical protein
MRQWRRVFHFIISTSFVFVLAPRESLAVILCNNLTGTPPPNVGYPQVYSDFRYIAGAGGGDDKIKTKKGGFNFLGFDPVNTHDVIVTIYDTVTELQLFSVNMFSGTGTYWQQPNVKTFKYRDPLSIFGVKKALIKRSIFTPNSHVLRNIVGKNVAYTNVPFPNLNGKTFVLELVDNSGVGICIGTDMPYCTTTTNRQRCSP